jgi:hypothetical protein
LRSWALAGQEENSQNRIATVMTFLFIVSSTLRNYFRYPSALPSPARVCVAMGKWRHTCHPERAARDLVLSAPYAEEISRLHLEMTVATQPPRGEGIQNRAKDLVNSKLRASARAISPARTANCRGSGSRCRERWVGGFLRRRGRDRPGRGPGSRSSSTSASESPCLGRSPQWRR